jgi:hypothetical protein
MWDCTSLIVDRLSSSGVQQRAANQHKKDEYFHC